MEHKHNWRNVGILWDTALSNSSSNSGVILWWYWIPVDLELTLPNPSGIIGLMLFLLRGMINMDNSICLVTVIQIANHIVSGFVPGLRKKGPPYSEYLLPAINIASSLEKRYSASFASLSGTSVTHYLCDVGKSEISYISAIVFWLISVRDPRQLNSSHRFHRATLLRCFFDGRHCRFWVAGETVVWDYCSEIFLPIYVKFVAGMSFHVVG